MWGLNNRLAALEAKFFVELELDFWSRLLVDFKKMDTKSTLAGLLVER